MRVLTWDLNNPLKAGAQKRQYVLNGRYEPVEVRINASDVSAGGNLIIDVNDDGTSIFGTKPALATNHSLKRWRTFNSSKMEDGSVITLDVDQIADNIDGVTVELDLAEL